MKYYILLVGIFSTFAHAQLLQEMTSAAGSDVRASRLPALFVEKGEPPSAFLAPGAFESVWTGKIVLPARYRLIFSFEGEGTATLTVAGEEVLTETGKLGTARSASTRLNRGTHDIKIRYRSRDDGSAHFRLLWEERSFPKQSMPPTVFTSETTEQLSASLLQRQGREIFAMMHCAKCHISRTGHGSNPMQEIQEIAPILVNSGDKVNADWLRKWLTSPHALRPGTPMPSLFDPSNDQHQQKIADVVAYLMAQKSPTSAAQPEFTADEVKKGGEHFHQLACAACHTLPDAQSADSSGRRIPLHHVAEKFRPAALAAYLKDPSALAPHRGMPNLRLNDEEIRTLSAFLLTTAPAPAAIEPVKGDAARGATVAMEHHCYACHAGMPAPAKLTTPALEDIFLADWATKGCVSATPNNPKVPDLQLSETSRNALLAFRNRADQASKSLQHNDQSEAAERKFHSLRCDACHSRDSTPATLDLSETKRYLLNAQTNEEKVDQSLPHMTYIGEMLQSSYTRQVISGNVTARARPWLSVRMPSYALHADSLAHGFASIHGIDPQEKIPFPEITPATAAIGAALIDKETGFGCNTCHGVGDKGPTAAFEVMGINFDQSSTRLRREWYDRWMDHPAAITPTTKMPQYAPSGISQNAALEGDGKKQFDAIWQYLQTLKREMK